MPPLVTAVLCTYNRVEFLEDALNCIFTQTYPDIEVVVVDDASTNQALFDLLDSYADRIRLVRRDSNSSTCERPRYDGAKEARGKYCAFLDSDDVWVPDKLEKQVAFMEEHEEIALCHSYASIIDEYDTLHGVRHEGKIPATGPCAKELIEHCFISISSVVVRRDAWLGAIDESALVDFGMDWDIFLSIAKKGDIGFLPEVLASYRRWSLSVAQHKWRRNPENVVSLERIKDGGVWRGIVSEGAMRDRLARAYHENAEHYLYGPHPYRAAYFAWKGIRHGISVPAFLGLALKGMVKSAVRR